jgi:hypothetical protein
MLSAHGIRISQLLTHCSLQQVSRTLLSAQHIASTFFDLLLRDVPIGGTGKH